MKITAVSFSGRNVTLFLHKTQTVGTVINIAKLGDGWFLYHLNQ